MKELYQARDPVEAQLLKDFLASYHIETVTQGEYLSGAAGELSALQFPVIWVTDDRDVQRGRELIGFFFEHESAGSPWCCSQCDENNEGQFHLCWQCGATRE